VVDYGSLKTKENFKLLAQKVVAVAYEKFSLTRGSKYSIVISLTNFWYFGKLVAEERWSAHRRFDSTWNKNYLYEIG